MTESVKKTDKRNARTLAEFLEKDMLPESVLCSQESEEIRRVIKSHTGQSAGILKKSGSRSFDGLWYREQTWSAAKQERLRILCGLEDHRSYGNAAQTVKPLLETIDQIASEIKRLEKVLAELVAEDKDVELLQTIPGVGLITAATIRAYTDDINRYENAGLVPWVQNSNETVRHGHISRLN